MKVSRVLVQLRLTTGMSPCTELRSDLRDDGAQCVRSSFGTRARRVSLTVTLLHARDSGSILAGLVCITEPLAWGLLQRF